MRRASLAFSSALAVLLVASACTSQGSGGANDSIGTGGSAVATFRVLDLSTGVSGGLSEIPDLTSNPIYKDRYIVLRHVPAGQVRLGGSGCVLGTATESVSTVNVDGCYMSIWEVTQAQWLRLSGSSDWTTVTPSSVVGGAPSAASLPATGLSEESIGIALAGAAAAGLRLPTPAEWEYACRAGAPGMFHWGDDLGSAIAGRYAAVRETGATGPLAVGSKEPNAFGLYDLHGNAWEMDSDGNLRGGSWNCNLITARAGNRTGIGGGVDHGLVGLRVVSD